MHPLGLDHQQTLKTALITKKGNTWLIVSFVFYYGIVGLSFNYINQRHNGNSGAGSRNASQASQAPRHVRSAKVRKSCGHHPSKASIVRRIWSRAGLISSWPRHKRPSPR